MSELEDGFAGERYRFPVGQTIKIPIDAARHIFAYGVSDRLSCVIRLGWTLTANDLPQAYARLEKFQISKDDPGICHSLSPVVETRVPLPPKGAGGKRPSLNA